MADQARKMAERAGLKLPVEPSSSNEDVRQKIATKLGMPLFNVGAALSSRRTLARRAKLLVDDELQRAEAVKADAEKRLQRTLREAEEAVARAEEIERKAKERLAKAREREQASKPKRQPYGAAKYKFESQKQPQIPAVLFGTGQFWVLDAIDAYAEWFLEQHGVPTDTSKTVRQALDEMLQKPRAIVPMAKDRGGRKVVGPFRLAAGSDGLLDQIRDVAAGKGVRESDVIRGALAAWLVGNGFGPRRGKK